ncbi:hypothetical protein Tco_0015008 [Tanacetum coccineum]
MDDPDITMEEYIRLEEEKAQRRGETFNWQTTTFGKREHYYEEECFTNFEEEFPAIVFGKMNGNSFDTEQRMIMGEYDDESKDFETKFPTIVLDNTSTSGMSPLYEPTVNSKNDNNDMPLTPKPTVNYLDGLDCFNDFENEFPAIVYNDGLTSKSYLEIKTLVNTEHIDEFNLIDEASLSEYDEEIISCFNDLFNITHPDDSKSEKDNDDCNISIIPLSEGNKITHKWTF